MFKINKQIKKVLGTKFRFYLTKQYQIGGNLYSIQYTVYPTTKVVIRIVWLQGNIVQYTRTRIMRVMYQLITNKNH